MRGRGLMKKDMASRLVRRLRQAIAGKPPRPNDPFSERVEPRDPFPEMTRPPAITPEVLRSSRDLWPPKATHVP